MSLPTWTQDDLETTSWHDCHVHGWSLVEREHGHADLTLDIDFITEWLRPSGHAFRVAPATLVFLDVFALRFAIDFTNFAVRPFSITGIEREERVDAAGYRDFLYRMRVPELAGEITFAGDRFVQTLRAEPMRSESPSLTADQRRPRADV